MGDVSVWRLAIEATLKHIPKTIEVPDLRSRSLRLKRARVPRKISRPKTQYCPAIGLRESLGIAKGDDTFERVIKGDELQPVNFLERGGSRLGRLRALRSGRRPDASRVLEPAS